MSNPQRPHLEVIYDGDCPFCSSYVAYCRLKEAFPDVNLPNARDVPDRVAGYRRKGMDINKGMIVIYGNAVYFGDQAIAILTQIAHEDGILQKMMKSVFRWPRLGRIAYAVLRFGRNATLRLLRRRKID